MFTPDNITELNENEIFVFGSNKAGNHAGGAARIAVDKFGAVMGQAEGLQGQSYAIPTIDENMERVDEYDLLASLMRLSDFAQSNKDKTFYLTKIGCGIAGFDTNEIAYLVLKAKLPDNVIIPEEFTKIHGYKVFYEDLTCRDIQYEVGKTYTQNGKIKVCENGLHFCINPMNILQYYTSSDNGKKTRFCEVEADGEMRCKKSKAATAGNYGAATVGDGGAATVGDGGAATAGDGGAATAGNGGAAMAGDGGAATSRGKSSSGKNGLSVARGNNVRVRGGIGAILVIAEENNDNYDIMDWKAVVVDGEKVKADTWYRLEDSKLVEVV